MEESSKSKRKKSENGGDDRLSSLPDSLLCHILSFLPTKTCVCSMSLVSHRYLHLWKDLQAFDFYLPYFPNNTNGESERFKIFVDFVFKVFSLAGFRNIRKLRLSCGQSELSSYAICCVDVWLLIAAKPHLEELHLPLFSTAHPLGFRLPLPILSCTNLHSIRSSSVQSQHKYLCNVLRLCGDICVNLKQSSEVWLPSLKTLQLVISIADVNSIDILLSACPILETLELFFLTKSFGKLTVPSSLKSFKLTVENVIEACLEIDTPGLKYLSLTNIILGDATSIWNLHNVEEAYVDVFSGFENEPVDPLLTLLQALSGIKRLVLRCYTTKLSHNGGEHSRIQFPLPEFCHLLYLELILPSFDTFLYDVLQKCPRLQALIIQNDKSIRAQNYNYAAKPESVPNCLISHLTFIHFKGYQGNSCEMEFASYVLRYGLVLKTLLISGFLSDKSQRYDKYRLRREFSNMPRCSTVFQVKLD